VAGAAFIVITRGFGDPLDWDYAVLEARPDRAPTESVGELINDLRQKVLPVIDDTHIAVKALTAVASRLQDPQGPMQQLLVNLSSITGEIMQGKGVVGRLVAEEKLADDLQDMLSKMSAIVAQMMPFMDELSTTVQNVAGISDKINAQAKNLPEMSQNVNEVLVSVNQVLVDLRQTTPELPRIVKNVQQATMSMPVLLLQTHQVMLELERLLKQLQTHWLLGSRKAVQEPRSHRISPSEVDP
jgi:phospholipid/cholesterol/gamma-HCH transport system substrate-binding protein